MNLNYDFEKYTPPKISEERLILLSEKRKAMKTVLILGISSHLLLISMALSAFLLAPYSLTLSYFILGLLALSLAGSGVIAVFFTKSQLEKSGPTSQLSFMQ